MSSWGLRQKSLNPMGHSVQMNLAAYCRWCGDEVVDAALTQAGIQWIASSR